ncbi:hypothetical protein QTP88_026904 [Uroleucon formosanum]
MDQVEKDLEVTGADILRNISTGRGRSKASQSSLINQDGRCVMEIRSRIAQAKSAFMKKKNLLCSNSTSIRVRKRFIKVYVWSVAQYGCETWVLNKAEQRTLESFEMWCWRKMLRVNWIEHQGEMEGKRGQGRPRISFVKQMISDARLSSYAELKMLAGNREEWREHVQLQNQP